MEKIHRPGLREKLFFLTSGIIVSIPMAVFFEPSTAFLSNFFPQLQAEILSIAVLPPLIEEFAKAYPLFFRHGESQRSLFTLGFLVGLGFGITEFLEYVLILMVSPLVRLPGIFVHAALTSTVAYGVVTKRSALFFLIAFALHSAINFTAVLELPDALYALLLFATYIIAFNLYRKTSEKMIEY